MEQALVPFKAWISLSLVWGCRRRMHPISWFEKMNGLVHPICTYKMYGIVRLSVSCAILCGYAAYQRKFDAGT